MLICYIHLKLPLLKPVFWVAIARRWGADGAHCLLWGRLCWRWIPVSWGQSSLAGEGLEHTDMRAEPVLQMVRCSARDFCSLPTLEAPGRVEAAWFTAACCRASCNYGSNWSVSGIPVFHLEFCLRKSTTCCYYLALVVAFSSAISLS